MKKIKIRQGSIAWWIGVLAISALALWEMYVFYIFLYVNTL